MTEAGRTMKRPLRIVIVSYVDDNFGDNLIRITFQALLEVALENHGLASDDFETIPMSLKHVDEDLLRTADAIFFAGGGLFGLSYLNFFEHLNEITTIADQLGVPVVFSSMGLNNMSADGGNVDAIAKILRRKCVRAIAVRENLPLFEELVTGLPFDVRQIADPAVWTKYVYGMTEITPNQTIGINVVRGGLFAANDKDWGLSAELRYLTQLSELARGDNQRAQFYTNGSLDDNRTLRFFAREQGLTPDQVVLPQTTREVVEAVASHSAIASIRMHSSIIAYSFGIPTIALGWNDKLPHFYEAIGHADRVVPFGEWTGERAYALLRGAGTAPEQDSGYQEYLMSVYTYIHAAVGEHVLAATATAPPVHDFTSVADHLRRRSKLIDEDEHDLRLKLGKAERAYLGNFITIRSNQTKLSELSREVERLTAQIDSSSAQAEKLQRQVSTLQAQTRKQQKELEMRLSTRMVRRLRRIGGKLLRRLRLR